MRNADAYVDNQSLFLKLDGMMVHYKREGKGPSVVLLHGSGSSLHCFDQVVPQLTQTYQVIRLDLPGAGVTGARPDRNYSIESYVAFLDRFLAKLGVSTFLLAGNSLGGNIAWNYALSQPVKVNRLILMNATGYPGKSLPIPMRLARSALGRFLLKHLITRAGTERNLNSLVGSRMHQVDQAMVARVHDFISRPGNRQAFIDLARTDQADRSKEVSKIKVPTLVLRGEGIDGQHFAREIPNAREILLSGVGHLIPDEAPEEVAKAIRSEMGAV